MGSAPLSSTVLRDQSIRVFDRRDVTFIDAAGLGILRDALRRSAQGAVVRHPPPCLTRLLDLVGLDLVPASPT